MQSQLPRERDAFEVARETLRTRYGTIDPEQVRRLGGDDTEVAAAADIARRAVETLTVGTRVYVPNRLVPDHSGYALAEEIFAKPGPIVSIEDGWAMVDLGSWGQFGCPLADLRPVEEASTDAA